MSTEAVIRTPDREPEPPARRDLAASRLLALLPNPIPPWLLLVVIIAMLATVISVLIVIIKVLPALVTAGLVSGLVGAGVGWTGRRRRGRWAELPERTD